MIIHARTPRHALQSSLVPFVVECLFIFSIDILCITLSGALPAWLNEHTWLYINVQNNPDMTSSAYPGLDSWLRPDYSHMLDYVTYLCPQPYRPMEPSAKLQLDPSYYGFSYCFCVEGTFGIPGQACIACPAHGKCPSRTSAVLFSEGYFPAIQQSESDGGFAVELLSCGHSSGRRAACRSGTVRYNTTVHAWVVAPFPQCAEG